MELEVFVHGAMCLALSGQCLLSAWLNGRSGNQGRCTQPCRFEYRALGLDGGRASGRRAASSLPEGSELLVEEYTRPGEHVWSVRRDERDEPFSSFWAPEDLCLYPWLPWFLHNRVTALKIEGRMKSAGWAAHAVDVYRTALDALSAPDGPGKAPFRPEAGMRELLYAATRPLGSGFFLPERRHLTREFLERGEVAARPNRSGEGAIPLLGREVLARVLEEKSRGVWLVEAHGNWRREQDVEIMLPGMRRPLLIGGSYGLENQRGELIGRLGNGNRGLLYADQDDLAAGLFIRASACR
jgi:putative protease